MQLYFTLPCNCNFPFVKPHLDYSDKIHGEPYNASFHQEFEKFQYNASLDITGAIKSTSKKIFYQELGLESLQLRYWYNKV